MILIDTSVFSLALRRRSVELRTIERHVVEKWAALAQSGQAALVGPVRQEILSGIRSADVYNEIRAHLSRFPHFEVLRGDYDQAAAFFNTCLAKGVTGSNVDMLICAVAVRNAVPVFTIDTDFNLYVEHLPLRLHAPA